MVGKFLRGFLILAGLLLLVATAVLVAMSDEDIPHAKLAEKYASADSKFITLPSGASVHYRIQGAATGPALVLLHGSNASLHTWEPWVSLLRDQFRIVSLDLPSHGLTGAVPGDDYSQEGMAQFLDEFTKAIGVERFALAGNSMGGGIAARFAIHHPERLSHLILVDASGMPTKTPRDPGLGFTIARIPVLQYALLRISPRSLFEDGLKKAIENDALVTPEMIDRYWELNRREGNRAATLKRFQSKFDNFVETYASQIKVPTLILWGSNDTLTPPDMGEAYQAAIKGSRLVVFSNTGHIPMEEVPDTSAAMVRDFLTSAPAQ